MSDFRGLVVSCPVAVSGPSVLVKSSALDPQETRLNLLFWDALDFPANNIFHIGLGPDEQFLASTGVLSRTEARLTGNWDGAMAMRAAHTGAFRFLDKRQPGAWSLAVGENSISFDDDQLDEGRGALVNLYRAIPVPDKDVPLEDILKFRQRRRSELLALRHHLEAVYQKVISAGDGALAWNTEVERLQEAIKDHIKASKESGLRFRNVSLSANLNLVGLARSAVTFTAAQSAGLPAVESLLAGAVASISVNVGSSLKGASATGTPFRYVSAYHEEIF